MFHDMFTDPGVDNLFYDFRHEAKIRYRTVGARVVRVERLHAFLEVAERLLASEHQSRGALQAVYTCIRL